MNHREKDHRKKKHIEKEHRDKEQRNTIKERNTEIWSKRKGAEKEGKVVQYVATFASLADVATYTPLFTLIPFPVVVTVVVGGRLALLAEMNWPKVEPVVAAGSLFWPCTQRL